MLVCHDCVHSLLSRAIVARVPNFLYDCKTYPTLIPSSFTPKTSVRFVLCNGSTRSTTAYFIVLPLNSLHTNFKALSGKKRWVHFQLLKRVNAQHRGIFHTYFSPRSQETRRSHIHPQPFPPPPAPKKTPPFYWLGSYSPTLPLTQTPPLYCPTSNPAFIQSTVFVQALAMTSNLGLHSTRPTEDECPLKTFSSLPSSARQA